jgi:hypothetical protein
MSMFERSDYRWRETCFVLFDPSNRPVLEKVEQVLSLTNSQYLLMNLSADEQGLFDSLSLISPEDFSALDVCYIEGEEVIEQTAAMIEDIGPAACEEAACEEGLPDGIDGIEEIKKYTARLDVLHFEYTGEDGEQSEDDAMLDPSALLLVLAALATLTDGVAIDPQSGTIIAD